MFNLASRCLIGRAPICDLCLDDPRVSGEHAVIQHSRGCWRLRDLNSRNGTFLDRKRIIRGDWIFLQPGSELSFGGKDVSFVLFDATMPVASARNMSTGEVRTATKGLLLLPNDETPSLSLHERFDGKWIADRGGEQKEVNAYEPIVVDGVAWKLDLPESSTAMETSDVSLTPDRLGLRFGVTRDEEHIELTMIHDGGETRIASRSYHYVLLTLAREWLADEGALPEERGWVDRDKLCRMLSVDATKLNVDIYRARGQLSELGVSGAADLVLRRPYTGQLRLGVQSVEIVKLWTNEQEGPPSGGGLRSTLPGDPPADSE